MSGSLAGNTADLNHDGFVDFHDYLLFAETWKFQQFLLAADMDRNGLVESNDLSIFCDNWLGLDMSLVGYWRFDDGMGSEAADLSHYNNTGTLINSPIWTTGWYDGGLAFDGVDTAVEVSMEQMDPNSGTVSLWCYPKGFSDSEHYLFGHTKTANPWTHRIQLYTDDPNGYLDLGLGDSHGRHTNIKKLQTHSWFHIVLTWDRGDYVVYVNGQPEATGSYTGLYDFTNFADIDNDGSTVYGDESFEGILDEVQIYNRALPQNQVQQLYQSYPDMVYIDDPGVDEDGDGIPDHEGFTGYMSKYEITNAQYCHFLNQALASGDVIIQRLYKHPERPWPPAVYGNSGPYAGQFYYGMSILGAQISHSGGEFYVRSRDGHSMANHPVVQVSWYGAMAFARYYGWRLPTEWEWQAVADFDGSYTYGCGTTINKSKANYDDANPLGLCSYPYTSPVGYYPAYGYGMCDMAGNVWEWTDSWYSGEHSYRVIRGGSWLYNDFYCGVSYRHVINLSDSQYSTYGFRVCR